MRQIGGRKTARKKNLLPPRPLCCRWCPHSCGDRLRSECPSYGWRLSPPSVSLHLGQGENMDTAQKASKHHYHRYCHCHTIILAVIILISILIIIIKSIIVTLIPVIINIIIVVNLFITIIIMVNNNLKLSLFFPSEPQYCNENQIQVSAEKEIKWKKM